MPPSMMNKRETGRGFTPMLPGNIPSRLQPSSGACHPFQPDPTLVTAFAASPPPLVFSIELLEDEV